MKKKSYTDDSSAHFINLNIFQNNLRIEMLRKIE